ncbi:MAG: zinc ribbon domain-containing protein [Methylophilaceae bacterium]|nr:zinc ribbon domain-containing protein [Methylophilaceae bacterium]
MPFYDYQCSRCGFKKEVLRKVSEPNLGTCPACGEETFAKQLSAPSFQMTGVDNATVSSTCATGCACH